MNVVEAQWPIGRETSCDDGLGLDFLSELEALTVADGMDKTTVAWPSWKKGHQWLKQFEMREVESGRWERAQGEK